MTGLLGGGHAIYWDAARDGAQPRLLRRRARARAGRAAELSSCEVPFGEELVHYAVGPGVVRRARACPPGSTRSGARPGGCRGRGSSSRRSGSPATACAMPPAHAACLAMLAPVMTMREGARIYAPGGRLLEAGDLLAQPGLVAGARAGRRRGRGDVSTRARSARRCSRCRRARRRRHRADLDAYEAALGRAGRASPTRARASSRAAASPASPRPSRGCRSCAASAPPSACSRCSTRSTRAGAEGTRRTSSPSTPRATACVLTTSLGLGSGDLLPGLDLHLNSMLGETDLLRGPARARRRGWRA